MFWVKAGLDIYAGTLLFFREWCMESVDVCHLLGSYLETFLLVELGWMCVGKVSLPGCCAVDCRPRV